MNTNIPKETLITRRGPGRAVWTLTLALALLGPAVCAANTTLTNDANTGTSGPQDGSITWNSNTTADWWNGTTDVVWPSSGSTYTAVIGAGSGAAGTVTVT